MFSLSHLSYTYKNRLEQSQRESFTRIWFAEMIEYAKYSPQNGNGAFSTSTDCHQHKQLAHNTFRKVFRIMNSGAAFKYTWIRIDWITSVSSHWCGHENRVMHFASEFAIIMTISGKRIILLINQSVMHLCIRKSTGKLVETTQTLIFQTQIKWFQTISVMIFNRRNVTIALVWFDLNHIFVAMSAGKQVSGRVHSEIYSWHSSILCLLVSIQRNSVTSAAVTVNVCIRLTTDM